MINNDLGMNDKELDLQKQAKELIEDLMNSGEADRIRELFCTEDSIVEAVIFELFEQATNVGDIVPTAFNKPVNITDCDCPDNHLSPIVMMGADIYRCLMFTAFSIGLRFQQKTQNLESLWSVETNDSPYDSKGV